jgi:hypothetical protein
VEPNGKDLVAFFDYAASKGLMNKDWAATLKSATKVVLSTVEPEKWESMDIESLDLDNFVQRFERLRMGDLKPDSMNVYGKRIRNAITAYREFLRSPSTWQYTGSRSDQPGRATRRAPKTTAVSRTEPTEVNGGATPPGLISYPYPLRPNVVLSIALPPDLTQKEAVRLSAFLHTLAVDEQLALPVSRERTEAV